MAWRMLIETRAQARIGKETCTRHALSSATIMRIFLNHPFILAGRKIEIPLRIHGLDRIAKIGQ
jgi:hypothetical protein